MSQNNKKSAKKRSKSSLNSSKKRDISRSNKMMNKIYDKIFHNITLTKRELNLFHKEFQKLFNSNTNPIITINEENNTNGN